jgi:N-acetylglucosamine kinase-like BadF-type ATPase
VIASICSIAGWCADRGDPAAADIFGKAAFHLARQLRTAAERCGNHRIPVTVSGGAWKATPLFFQAFSHSLKQELPLAELRRPLFEPVVGGVLLGLRDEGFPVRERIGELKRNFSDYAYDEKNFRT